MSLRLRLVPDPLPEVVRRRIVRALFRSTVDAFGAEMPDVRGWPSDRLLDAYAARSEELARAVLDRPERRRHAASRLHANTERMGRAVRRLLGIRSSADAMEAARRLYATIGIDLRGAGPDRVVVTRCSFASRYAPEVCAVMAAADAGLFAGLTAGRRLSFVERISSGAPACVATLSEEHAS
ncbi:MAG TPA: hypothetical protein VLA82_05755 [Actinomycetota bacterium]|nr:hypothetical protein [Actinomycetota bacterium]